MGNSTSRGFTLIELLVAMAVASIVLAAVVSAYQLQVRSQNTQELLTDMNQTTRAALEIMINEIRAVRLDPTNLANAGFLIAEADELSFTADLGNTAGTSFAPDGNVTPPNDGPNERVRYALYTDGDGNQHLGRSTGTLADGTGGATQPLARNVDALNFVYLDAQNAVLAAPVSAANMPNIRRVEVTLVARAGDAGGVGFVRRHTDTTTYENQRGDTILPAQNDGFRRLRLTTSVQCLNQ